MGRSSKGREVELRSFKDESESPVQLVEVVKDVTEDIALVEDEDEDFSFSFSFSLETLLAFSLFDPDE